MVKEGVFLSTALASGRGLLASVDSSEISAFVTKEALSEKELADAARAAALLGRMEVVSISRWHTKVRVAMGNATFF